MMQHDFDLFEKLADGPSMWRTCASGQTDAQQKLENLTDHSQNEFYSIDIESGEVLPFKLARRSSHEQLNGAARRYLHNERAA